MQDSTLTQEILTRVDALAAKLGVTVEYLWPHLVRYEQVLGASVVLAAMFFLGVTAVFVRWFRSVEAASDSNYITDEGTSLMIAGVISAIASAILVILAFTIGLPGIFAPEAVAFRGLLP